MLEKSTFYATYFVKNDYNVIFVRDFITSIITSKKSFDAIKLFLFPLLFFEK